MKNHLLVLRILVFGIVITSVACEKKTQPQPQQPKAEEVKNPPVKKAVEVAKVAAVAKGETFTVAVPEGYKQVTDPRLTAHAPGGVMLAAERRISPKAFLSSIVATKVPAGKDFEIKEASCKTLAHDTMKGAPVKFTRTALIDTPAGKACQWEVLDNKVPHRGAIGTLMYKTRDNCWVLTCNLDTRDNAARSACTAAINSWKFN